MYYTNCIHRQGQEQANTHNEQGSEREPPDAFIVYLICLVLDRASVSMFTFNTML
jgi:hypothetical protein